MNISLPKVARVAYIVAFTMAASGAILALTGQVILLPFLLIPLIAGLGIRRGRVWSAYGFALYLLVQGAMFPFVVLRSRASFSYEAIAGIFLSLLLIPLFFFAGKRLEEAQSNRGRAWPWVMVSLMCTLPLFFLQAFINPTGSMEETLLIGDRILVRTFPRPVPSRGDLIVFVYPVDRHQTFNKRVVGVGGDRIKIVQKKLFLNGIAQTEPYAVNKTDYVDSYRDNFPNEPNVMLDPRASEMLASHTENGEVVVPPGKLFVLGDNRDNSLDSRYWGFVDLGDVIGKPVLIYGSQDTSADDVFQRKPFTWGRIRWERLFKLL